MPEMLMNIKLSVPRKTPLKNKTANVIATSIRIMRSSDPMFFNSSIIELNIQLG